MRWNGKDRARSSRAAVVGFRNRLRQYSDLCFGKRGAVELYDCEKDPEQVHNLAANPEYAGVLENLQGQLVARLKETGDPRFTDQSVWFDEYPYRRMGLKENEKR